MKIILIVYLCGQVGNLSAQYCARIPYTWAGEKMMVQVKINDELKAGFIWESIWEQLEGGEKIVEVNGKRFDKVDAWQAMTADIVSLTGEEAEIVVLDREGKEKKLIIRRE